VSDRQAALGHHLDKVPVRKLVAQVPADAKNNDLLLEVPALEQVILAWTVTHAGQSP